MRPSSDLGSAAGERVEHPDGRRLCRREAVAVRPDQLQSGPCKRAPPERPEVLDARGVDLIVIRVRALRLVVAADAEIVVRGPRQVIAEPQCLIERHRVVHLTVDEQIVAGRFQVQGVRQRAAGQRRVQIGRLVRIDPEYVDIERALVLDQRPAEPEAVVDVLLRSLNRDERAAAAPSAVAHSEVGVVADATESRLGDDLDRDTAGTVELGGKLIARDADRSDLRLRRQRATFEAVDADHRARSGHVLQLLLQLRRIVGQRFDLIARERGAER